MWLPILVVFSCCVLGAQCADPRSQFVHRLLSVYRISKDQAKVADRDNDGNISENEFLQSLFLFTDTDVRDRRVTQAEFIDGYRRYFALPSELLVVMFDLLDDLNDDGGTRQNMDYRDNRNNQYFQLYFQFARGNNIFQNNYRNHGDGVLTSRDVTYQTFVGNSKQPSVDDFQKALITWVGEAANRLYTINYQPHIPGNPWDREFDYEQWFHSVDRNNDSLISFGELRDEFRRYSSDGRVTRARWTERNMQVYEDKEWLSNVVFDFWDKNRDLRLDDLDIGLVLREADQNQDRRVTTVEFHRFMERYNKLARRRLATPVRPVIFDCPSPWWQSFGCRPRVDATRAAMDMDDNFDGWITPREFGKRISYYDRNGDGWASRFEVVSLETLRYGVSGPAASILFDVYDRNSDGRYDHLDLQFMLPEGRLLCFCDARKAVLELVRLAERFRFSPQAQGPLGSLRNAMRWQLSREWAWRDRNKNIWRWLTGQSPFPWGTGGCREGDCTGRDWRGTGWYSPFDWRQQNRVPENFLQWSYLQDVPRTILLPPRFQGGHGAFPGDWWSQQWSGNLPTPGDSGIKDRQDSSKDQDDGTSDRRQPSLPLPTWLTRGGLFDDFWKFPGDENDTNPFWSGPGSFWSNPNANFWEQINRRGGPLPWWVMSGGTDNRNEERSVQAPWFFNWDPSVPGRSGNRDDQKGMSSPQSRSDNTRRPDTTTAASVASKPSAQGATTEVGVQGPARPSSKGGKRLQDGASRFRRQVAPPEKEVNQTFADSLPPPPSLSDTNSSAVNVTSASDTATVALAEDINITINGTDVEENATRSDENKDLAEEREEIARAMARNGNPSSQSLLWDSTTWKDAADNVPTGSGYGDWSDTPDSWQDTSTEPSAWNINRWWNNNQMGDSRWVNSYLGDAPGGNNWQTYDYWSNTYPGYRSSPLWKSGSYYYYSPQWWAGYTGYSDQNTPYSQGTRWGSYYPSSYVSYPHRDQPPLGYYSGHLGLWKRNVDDRQDPNKNAKQASRMMSVLSTYWPWWGWWNFYSNFNNNYAPWPYDWTLYSQRNRWFPWYLDRNWDHNWMGSNFGNGYLFSKTDENHKTSSDAKLEVKRSARKEGEETIKGEHASRWLTEFEPQWLNPSNGMGRTWKSNDMWSMANIWNWNWNWNMYNKMLGIHNPLLSSAAFTQGTGLPIVSPDQTRFYKRSVDSTAKGREDSTPETKENTSRSMGSLAFNWRWGWNNYWPFWRNTNMWNSYWPLWNNWRSYGPLWSSYAWQDLNYPSYDFSRGGSTQNDDQHGIHKRNTGDDNKDRMSRQMGGWNWFWPPFWGSYSPQWWNRNFWNNQWNDWNNRMWNTNQGYFPYHLFSFLRDQQSQSHDGSHKAVRRSPEQSFDSGLNDDENEKVAKMTSGYWPQIYSNGYNHYPEQYWNGYNYWPQWWGGYMQNRRYWPGGNPWSNNNWMWSRNQAPYPYIPFYYSQSDTGSQDQDHVVKRSAQENSWRSSENQEKQVSRMMSAYGGYWPQWWTGYQLNTDWPWGWAQSYSPGLPPYYAHRQQTPGGSQGCTHTAFKRSADGNQDNTDKEKKSSRMIGPYDLFMPEQFRPAWNLNSWGWNNPLDFSPSSYRNSWMWNKGQGLNPSSSFYLSSGYPSQASGLFKRSTVNEQTGKSEAKGEKASRMTGMYGDFWPQQYWNPYSSWPNRNIWNTHWPTWNNVWMPYGQWGSSPVSSIFSRSDPATSENMYSRFRRSMDGAKAGMRDDQKKVGLMMDGYKGFWPQLQKTYPPGLRWLTGLDGWNSYWPQWTPYDWSRNQPFFPYTPYYYMHAQGGNHPGSSPGLRHDVFKRNVDGNTPDLVQNKDEKVSRMNGWWPQAWNSYTYWPRWLTGSYNWNNWQRLNPYDWTWNRNQPFFPYSSYYYSQGGPRPETYPDFSHDVFKRSADGNVQDDSQSKDENVSQMNGWWPQAWNSYTYWPRWWTGSYNWNNWQRWNPYDWTWNRNQPFFPYSSYYYSQSGPRPETYPDFSHDVFKRSADGNAQDDSQRKDENVSRMNGWWPQAWNSYTYWPRWWTGSYNWNNWQRWNPYDWTWNRNQPFFPYSSYYYSQGGPRPETYLDFSHDVFKRSADGNAQDDSQSKDENVSRMNGWWPQAWNSYTYWPRWWTGSYNWNNWQRWNPYDWTWNRNQPFFPYSSYYYSQGGPLPETYPDFSHNVFKRSADGNAQDDSQRKDENVSRMNGWWPQAWNSYTYWPRWWTGSYNWNNWRRWNPYDWTWNRNQPFFPYSSYYYSQGGPRPETYPDFSHDVFKRSADGNAQDDSQSKDENVSRMNGWWPQAWNSYTYWPQWWTSSYNWNNWQRWNPFDWRWHRTQSFLPYSPVYYSQAGTPPGNYPDFNHDAFKRSVDGNTNKISQDKHEKISQMMGWYSGHLPQYGSSYWPQWWRHYYNWNSWPSQNGWNTYNPYYSVQQRFSRSTDRKQNDDSQQQESKQDQDKTISRMMGDYRGNLPQLYWTSSYDRPQWWGNSQWNRYWPWWNNMNWPEWNNLNWMLNRNLDGAGYIPFAYSKADAGSKVADNAGATKVRRSTETNPTANENSDEKRASRMMNDYGSYWPQQNLYGSRGWPLWGTWGNRNVWDPYWPGWSRSWMWSYNQPPSDLFAFTKSQPLLHSLEEARHKIARRESKGNEEDNMPDKNKAARMIGHYRWFRPYDSNFYNYWPQWWSQNFWDRYLSALSNWNRYAWMWGSNPEVFSDTPFYYSHPYDHFSSSRDSSPMDGYYQDGHAAFRRSVDDSAKQASHDKNISRMAGWYGWNWLQKSWPQWWGGSIWWDWNPWNRYDWMWNKKQAFSPYSPHFYAQRVMKPESSEHVDPAIYKRSTDARKHPAQDGDNVAKMTSGYGGYSPQQYWTSQSYWPWWWGNNWWSTYWPGGNDYARMWRTYNSWYPLFSYQVSKKNGQPGQETDYNHPQLKRSPDESKNPEKKESFDRWTNINNFWPDMPGYKGRLFWQEMNPRDGYSSWPFWDTFNQRMSDWNVFNSQGRYPPSFYFYAKGDGPKSSDTQPMLTKRDTTQVNPEKSSDRTNGPNLMDLLKKNNFWQTPGHRNVNTTPKPAISKRSTEEHEENGNSDNNDHLSRQMNGNKQNPSQLHRNVPHWSDSYNYFRPGPFTGHFLITKWNDDKMSDVNNNDLWSYWDWNSDQKMNELYQNNARQDNVWTGNDWNIYNGLQNYWSSNNWDPVRYGFGFPHFPANAPMWSNSPDFNYQKGADGLSADTQPVKASDSEDHEISKRSINDKTNASFDGENVSRQTSGYGSFMAGPQWNGDSFYRPRLYGNRYMLSPYGPWTSPYHLGRNWPRQSWSRHNQMWNDQISDWMWNNWLMTSNGQSWHNIEDANWNINGYTNGHGVTDPPQFRFENQEGIQKNTEAEDSSAGAERDKTVSKRSADEDKTSKPQDEDVKRQLGAYSYFPSYRPWSQLWRGYNYYWPMGPSKRYFWNRWNHPEWYNYHLWNNWYSNYRSPWNTQRPPTDSLWNMNMYRPVWDGMTRQFPQYFTTPMPSLSTTAETRPKQSPYTTPKTPKVDSKTDSEHKTALSKRSIPFNQGLMFKSSDIPVWTKTPTSPQFRSDYTQWPAWPNRPQYYDPRWSQIFFMQNGHSGPLQNSPTWDTYLEGLSDPSSFQYSKEGTSKNKAGQGERVMRRRSTGEVKEATEDPESKSKDPGVSKWINDHVFQRSFFRPGLQTTPFSRPWPWNSYRFPRRPYSYFPWWAHRNWYSPMWYSFQLWRNSWMANPQMWRYDDAWEGPSWSDPSSVWDASQLWNSQGQDEGSWPGNYWPTFDSTWNVDVSQSSPPASSDNGMQFTGASEVRQRQTSDEVKEGSADETQQEKGVPQQAARVAQHSLEKRSKTFAVKSDLERNLRASRQTDRRSRIYSRPNQMNHIYHASTGQMRGHARKRHSQDKGSISSHDVASHPASLHRVLSKDGELHGQRWKHSIVPSRQRRSVFNTQRLGWFDNFGQANKPYWMSGSWEISGNNQPWSKWTRWNKWNGGFVWNDQFDNLDSFSPFQSLSRAGSSSSSKDNNVQKRSAESAENQEEITNDEKPETKPARWMNSYGANTPIGMNFNWPGYLPWQPLASYDGAQRSNPLWDGSWNTFRNFRPFLASFPADQTPYDLPAFLRRKRAAIPPDQDVVAVEPELDTEQMFSKWMNNYGQMPGSWPMSVRNKWQMQNFDLIPGWTNAYQSDAGWEKPGWTSDPAWTYQPWSNKMTNENYWSDGRSLDPRFSQYFSRSEARDQDIDRVDRSSSQNSQQESEATLLVSEDWQAEKGVTPPSSKEGRARARRSIADLAAVLSKGLLRHKSATKSNTVSSSKDLGPRKIKRFSAEAEARLQIRLHKRSNGFEMTSPEASQVSAEWTTGTRSETETVKPDGREGVSTTNVSPAVGVAPESSSGQGPKSSTSPTGHASSQKDLSSPSPDGFRPPPTSSPLDKTRAEGRGEGISNANRPDNDNDSETMLSEYNYYDQDRQEWLNLYNPDTQNTSMSASGYSTNTSQWNDWLQLWAYGPNFWDSLGSWDGYPFAMPWNTGSMNFNPNIWSNPNFRSGNFGNLLASAGLPGCTRYGNYAGPVNYDASWSRMAHDYFSSLSDLYRNLWEDNCGNHYERGESFTGQAPGQGVWYPLSGPASQRGGWDQWRGTWGINPEYSGPCSYCRSPTHPLQDSCCQSWFGGTGYGQGLPAARFPSWQDRGPRSSYQDASVWGSPLQLNQFQDRQVFEHPQFHGRHPQADGLGATVFSGSRNYDQNLAKIQNWLWNNYWNSHLRGKQMSWNQRMNPPTFGSGLWGATTAYPGGSTPFPDSWRHRQEAAGSPWLTDSQPWSQQNWGNQQASQSPSTGNDVTSWDVFSGIRHASPFGGGDSSSGVSPPTDGSGYGDSRFGSSSPLAGGASIFEESSTGHPSFMDSDSGPLFPRPGPATYPSYMTTGASARLDSPISTPAFGPAGTTAEFKSRQALSNAGTQPLTEFQQTASKDC